jgi:hypothetical protein
MISQTQLVAELQRRGYKVTERQLRDWRAKGLLPPLNLRSQGRGLGVVRYWRDNERILSQTMTVCDLLDRNGRAKWALLWLWFAGYEVKLEIVRGLWLESLARVRKEWLGDALSKEDCEDALGDLSHRLAKGMRFATSTRALDLDWEELEPLLHETLNVCFNPDPEIAIDNQVVDAVRTLILHGTKPAAGPGIIDREDLERWLVFIKANLSIDARQRLISAVTNEELRTAHSRWSSVLTIIRSLTSNASGVAISDDMTQIGRQAAIQFGGFCIFGLLLVDRKGNGEWLDFHLEEARKHILAPLASRPRVEAPLRGLQKKDR